MLLDTAARGHGHGKTLLSHVENFARNVDSPRLYFAVLRANPRGQAFWAREGYVLTGFSRAADSKGLNHIITRRVKEF